MGRRKIEIQPLSDDRNRTVTFMKRKAGLFKKAYELSVLCNVDLAVIIVGGNNKVYEFSSVDTNSLVKFYQHSSPHESKSPENYGKYKKKATLSTGPMSAIDDEIMNEMKLEDGNGDSDYESASPEPKRSRKASPPSSIYSKQNSASSRFSKLANAQNHASASQPDTQSHRPILRVQIPSDAKSQAGSTETVTPSEVDAVKNGQPPRAESVPHGPINVSRYSFGKFKSPDSKKLMQLPLPINKSQTSSPSSVSVPQLPNNAHPGFFGSLPQPSPPGQYPPSILPTPVFNQVFNQHYVNQMGNGGGSNSSVGMTSSGHNMIQSNLSGNVQSSDAAGNASTADHDTSKFKPPFQQPYANGEQTPVSGLPSRYMNEIFPSPSNLYPPQEWSNGITPYSMGMSHYFVGMGPSANGATPLPLNTNYANVSRTPLQGNPQRPPVRNRQSSNGAHQLSGQGDASQGSMPQPSAPDFMGQYYKKS